MNRLRRIELASWKTGRPAPENRQRRVSPPANKLRPRGPHQPAAAEMAPPRCNAHDTPPTSPEHSN
jgi:hypothetical protein